MNAVEARKQVNEAYGNSRKWTRKTDGMDEQQILAIWFRLKAQGKIK